MGQRRASGDHPATRDLQVEPARRRVVERGGQPPGCPGRGVAFANVGQPHRVARSAGANVRGTGPPVRRSVPAERPGRDLGSAPRYSPSTTLARRARHLRRRQRPDRQVAAVGRVRAAELVAAGEAGDRPIGAEHDRRDEAGEVGIEPSSMRFQLVPARTTRGSSPGGSSAGRALATPGPATIGTPRRSRALRPRSGATRAAPSSAFRNTGSCCPRGPSQPISVEAIWPKVIRSPSSGTRRSTGCSRRYR